MRFLHLSDLHLGKRVCEFSMLDDQRYILEQILSLLDKTPVDGVLLAGDLYDKPVPPAEAVRLLDWFLTQLAERQLPVFAISGNHDSADRIAFGSALLQSSRVYVSPVFSGAPVPIPLTDEYGTLDVYLLPFLKPAMVRHVWPDEPVESYNDALACVLRHCPLDPAHRNFALETELHKGGALVLVCFRKGVFGARREHHTAGALLGVLPAAEQSAADGGAGGILPAAH